jgi:hypothetical protein
MTKNQLQIERVLDIPIREVSGLCLHRPPDGRVILAAIGDTTAEIAWTRLDAGLGPDWRVDAGVAPDWRVLDLATIAGVPGRTQSSQFEAIATEAGGRALILREYPASVLVLDIGSRALAMTIALVVRQGGELAAPGRTFAASLGEAMLPLRDGRLLITKEKDPPLILEVGPVGAVPLGIAADRLLAPDEPWAPPPNDPPRLEVLARWPLDAGFERRFRDISDAATGPDRCVYLLSDQSRCICRLPDRLPAPGVAVAAEAIWKLPKTIEKPEGLDFLPDGRALVAVDEKKARQNLFLLAPAIAAAL